MGAGEEGGEGWYLRLPLHSDVPPGCTGGTPDMPEVHRLRMLLRGVGEPSRSATPDKTEATGQAWVGSAAAWL